MEDGIITLNAVGDMIFTEKMREKATLHVADYLFQYLHRILSEADLNIGNLEVPLSDRGRPSDNCKEFVFRASPDWAKTLKRAGFNIISLANNHIMDYGPLALNDTINNLKKYSISYVGAGKKLDDACRPLICEIKGSKIAFLSFTYANSAKKRSPGCCPSDPNFVSKKIKSIKSNVDLVIVSIHHGVEYVDYPNRFIMSLYRGAVDAGADLVLGHHPHVVQGVEIYKKALIFYSLGNFISDYADVEVRKESYQRTALAYFTDHPPNVDDLRTIETFILQCKLNSKGIVDYKLIPIKSKQDFQLVIMDEHESQVFLNRVKEISEKISKPDDPIWDEMDDLLEKCREFSLQNLKLKDVLFKILNLRPRHFHLAIPFLKAKLFKERY